MGPGVVTPVQQSRDHLKRKQDGCQDEIGDTLQWIMFGFFAFGHRMGLAPKDSIPIIADDQQHLFGGGNVLPPLTGRDNPEHEKQKGNQPGVADKIVHFNGSLKTEQGVQPFDLKTGDQTWI